MGTVKKVSKVNKKPKRKEQNRQDLSQSNCDHCGKRNHKSQKCRLKNAAFYKCNKKGHIGLICKAVNYTEESGKNDILSVNSRNTGKFKIIVTIDIWGKPIVMEVDTGSSVSLISYREFVHHFGKIKSETPKSVLKTYSNETI